MDIFGSTTPASFTASVGSGVVTTMTNLWPVIAFAVAVPFAFYVAHKVIGLIPKSGGKKAS